MGSRHSLGEDCRRPIAAQPYADSGARAPTVDGRAQRKGPLLLADLRLGLGRGAG